MTELPIWAANSREWGYREKWMCVFDRCVHRAIDVQSEAERSRCKEERVKDRWARGRNMRGIGKLDPGMKKKMLNRGANTGDSRI